MNSLPYASLVCVFSAASIALAVATVETSAGTPGYTVLAGDYDEPRPSPSGDDDVFASNAAIDDIQTTVTEAAPPDERRIRVVGPTFFPDPEGALDLRAPARNRAR